MLSEREEMTFREIRRQLLADEDFGPLLRARDLPDPRAWARRFHAWVIGIVALAAAVLVLAGAHGTAVVFIAAAVVLGLARHIETAAERTTDGGEDPP